MGIEKMGTRMHTMTINQMRAASNDTQMVSPQNRCLLLTNAKCAAVSN